MTAVLQASAPSQTNGPHPAVTVRRLSPHEAATSIDALAVGISFAMVGYRSLHQLTFPLWAIGIGSLLFGITGQLLGIRFGATIRRRLKPELLGGALLIVIGCKILVSHLLYQ